MDMSNNEMLINMKARALILQAATLGVALRIDHVSNTEFPGPAMRNYRMVVITHDLTASAGGEPLVAFPATEEGLDFGRRHHEYMLGDAANSLLKFMGANSVEGVQLVYDSSEIVVTVTRRERTK